MASRYCEFASASFLSTIWRYSRLIVFFLFFPIHDRYSSLEEKQVSRCSLNLATLAPRRKAIPLPIENTAKKSLLFPPKVALPNLLALLMLTLYQHSLAYLTGGQCRFYPSCSEYAYICFRLPCILSNKLYLLCPQALGFAYALLSSLWASRTQECPEKLACLFLCCFFDSAPLSSMQCMALAFQANGYWAVL